MSPRATSTTKTIPPKLQRGESLALRDVGRLEPKERQHVQTWLKRNFCKADNFGCKLSVLHDGGLHLDDPDDSVGGAGEFKVHTIDLADGTPAFLAVMFVGGSEGSVYDRRKRRVAALAIEGELSEIGADYDDLAPALSRLIPGVKAIPKTPKRAKPFPPPPGSPADGAAWRALFPEPEAQRTIDLLVRSVEQHRLEGGTNLHWAFEHEHKIKPRHQPADPYEWLCAARSLEFMSGSLIDDNPLADLRPLAVFTQLRTLMVDVVPGTDLSPLGDLRSLETLTLNGGKAAKYGWLASLPALEEFSLSFGRSAPNPDFHLSLAANSRLRTFSLYNCPADLSRLELPKSLETLELRGPISDITPLHHLRALTELNLTGCRIRDFTQFAPFKSLETLDLRDNLVENLEGIGKLRELYDLDILANCIVDFSTALAWKKHKEDPEEVQDWIDYALDSQLDLTSPQGRAVLANWDSVPAWEALAAHFDTDRKTKQHAKDIRACLAGKEPDGIWFLGRNLPRK